MDEFRVFEEEGICISEYFTESVFINYIVMLAILDV